MYKKLKQLFITASAAITGIPIKENTHPGTEGH